VGVAMALRLNHLVFAFGRSYPEVMARRISFEAKQYLPKAHYKTSKPKAATLFSPSADFTQNSLLSGSALRQSNICRRRIIKPPRSGQPSCFRLQQILPRSHGSADQLCGKAIFAVGAL
jgi:hypothetical protein